MSTTSTSTSSTSPVRAWSAVSTGVTGRVVGVVAEVTDGLPDLDLVGLPDASSPETRDRVRAAVVNSGEPWPAGRIALEVAPAPRRPTGAGLDLALAAAVLAAAGQLPLAALEGTVLLGELTLDGRLRDVRGMLPCLLAARDARMRHVVVPASALPEAGLLLGRPDAANPGMEVVGARDLRQVLTWLREGTGLEDAVPAPAGWTEDPAAADLDIVGQDQARRACEIAAAGGHHLMLIGPPGSGKTMLARWLVGLLPPLSAGDALTLAAIRSAAGVPLAPGLSTVPPLVEPHPSCSLPALLGGGSGRPGAVSLAHGGLLFLDDAPDWASRVLDELRTPLQVGEVRLTGTGSTTCWPARFQLLLAADPCPCAAPDGDCGCPAPTRRRYLARLAGLVGRVDLCARTTPVTGPEPRPTPTDDTATVRARVHAARAAAAHRWAAHGGVSNAEVSGPVLSERPFTLPPTVLRPLDAALRSGQVSARGAERVLRVAWTLADLAGRNRPDADLMTEALSARDHAAASRTGVS